MVEAVAPEGAVVAEPVDHGSEGVGLGAVVGLAAGAAMVDEPGSFEDGEVLGDGGLGDAGVEGEGVDGLFALAGELFEERAAGGVGEGAEDVIGMSRLHRQNHSHLVMVCQEVLLFLSWCVGGCEGTILIDSIESTPFGFQAVRWRLIQP